MTWLGPNQGQNLRGVFIAFVNSSVLGKKLPSGFCPRDPFPWFKFWGGDEPCADFCRAQDDEDKNREIGTRVSITKGPRTAENILAADVLHLYLRDAVPKHVNPQAAVRAFKRYASHASVVVDPLQNPLLITPPRFQVGW
jgi:hypothetical protein